MVNKEEKARRMEIRKQIGSRVIEPPPPRVRSAAYLIPHACFSCRISFKYVPKDGELVCPNCSGPAIEMGRSFKAPKKKDVSQWKKVEKLCNAGFRFPINTGYYEVAPYPKKLGEIDRFIADNPRHPFRLRSYWPTAD